MKTKFTEYVAFTVAVLCSGLAISVHSRADFTWNKSTIGGYWLAFIFLMAYLKIRQLRLKGE
jgi:hypothetical protein